MRLTLYGTRGSSPISRLGAMGYGGNTTCIRVHSQCLPEATGLLVDAGTGMVPASGDMLKEQIQRLLLLMTHYHHDHTQGFPLAPHTYVKSVPVEVFGPREHEVGPREMLETIMSGPFFPVDFARVGSHVQCHDLVNIGSQVLAIHPAGGHGLLRLDEFETQAAGGRLDLPGGPVPLDECLVVRMHKTSHPEYTVTYRFEERPTGRVAVILTDHENTQSLPSDLRRHLEGVHLLIQDAQYLRRQYDAATAGFGHGTGDYSAFILKEMGVGRLGQTHHDPQADDPVVDAVVEEARDWLRANGSPELCSRVFACADYQEIEV